MHFSIVLLLYFISVSFSLSQKIGNAAIDTETPSPEWIKYQRERFEHNSKTHMVQATNKAQHRIINSKTPHDATVHLKQQHKVDTTSRHSGNYDHQKQQQTEFDNAPETNGDTIQSINTVQFPSIKGFIEFLKSLKQTWMKNSIFRIDDKIKLLQNLKDSLIKTIEKQFMILWQDDENDNDKETEAEDDHHDVDVKNQHLRSKRGILDESNINFPPYAALMSINFLTFSVFLIKLVLQVVNIIKSKHYQLSAFNIMDTGAIRNKG